MHHAHAPALLARLMLALASGVLAAGQGVAARAQSAPSLSAPDATHLWPRIFYTPEERASIERSRAPEMMAPSGVPTAALPTPTYRLDGVAQGRRGATAWINGQVRQQGQSHEGRTVHIGNGMVRLSQAGEPDIVLRPGQQSGEAGTTPQDVVPMGTVRKKQDR